VNRKNRNAADNIRILGYEQSRAQVHTEAEIERVLAPGGKLFIEEHQKNSVKLLDRLFQWHVPEAGFSYAQLETGMMDAGLDILETRAFSFFNS
jgi:hypothetical protein